MKIIFFVPALSQPRCIKRIKSISEAGYDVEVFGYIRGFYDINCMPNNVQVHNWGYVKSGSNFIDTFVKSFFKIRNVVKENPSNQFYAFGYIFALILYILRAKYIYEISDIIYAYFKSSIMRNCFKAVDKLIINKSRLTILTSAGFEKYLYKQKSSSNIIVIPNMVSDYFKGYPRKPITIKENIVFSYVGAFRYPNTVFRFARIIGEHYPKYEFHFYGDSQLTQMAKDLSNKYSNVKYFGKYKSPEDLACIYDKIDVIVACYESDKINEQIAEPNKLYEAICFCKPIIVSNNTYVSTRVSELQIGYSIDATTDANIRSLIDRINTEELHRFSYNEFKLNHEDYLYSSDMLLSRIKTIYD